MMLIALVLLVAGLGGLWAVDHFAASLGSKAFADSVKGVCSGLVVAANAVVIAALRKPTPEVPGTKAATQASIPEKNVPRDDQETWKTLYFNAIRDGNEKIARLNQEVSELARRHAAAAEGSGAFKYMLVSGLLMAIASAAVTLYAPPTPENWLSRHVPLLVMAYAVVAFGIGLVGGRSSSPPNVSIPFRVGFLAALYVNLCSVIINFSYAWKGFFSGDAPAVADVALGYLIIIARILVLPSVAMIGCWIGYQLTRRRVTGQ